MSAFWDDLNLHMKDPEFVATYLEELERLAWECGPEHIELGEN